MGKDDKGKSDKKKSGLAQKSKNKSLKEIADKKLKEAASKYTHGSVDFATKSIEHKALRKTLEGTKKKIVDAATRTATAEVLLTSEPGFIEMEGIRKVYSLKQKDIIDNVDLNTSKNNLDLQLTNFGPYCVNFSSNGR
jgi:U3 small nucleolar RNA-associated protein 7